MPKPAEPVKEPSIEIAEVAQHLRSALGRLHRVLRQHDNEGLSPTLAAVLSTLDREGPLTLGDLANRERMARPSMTNVVDKLTRAGLAERLQDEDDRRVFRVRISAAGRRKLNAVRRRRTVWLELRIERLSAHEIRLLAAAANVLESIASSSDSDHDN